MNHKKSFPILMLVAALFSFHPALADDLEDARTLLRQGQPAQAMEKINAILTVRPKDAQARFLKGLVEIEQGQTQKAIVTFTALTRDHPDLPEPYNNLAVIYASQGDYEKARDALERAIRTHPTYATAYENLGDLYARMASEAYGRALQLEKGNPSTQAKLALIRELFGSSPRVSGGDQPPPTASPSPPSQPTAVSMADPATEIVQTIQAWAAAWSAQDSAKYLGFYAQEFKAPDGMPRKDWEALRKQRIAAPRWIQVTILDPKVRLVDDTHATLTFRQVYRASHLRNTARKRFDMVKSDGRWLIAADHSDR